MTQIPARLIRPHAQRSPYRIPLSERRTQQCLHILDTARKTFIAEATTRLTLPQLALALELSPATIRRHICDMAYLAALILTGHLQTIVKAIEAIPATTPNLTTARRAEYRRLTTAPDTDTARLHVLFLQERILLPPDQRDPLEQRRRDLGALLGGPDPDLTLTLLDTPTLSLPAIEAMLQAHATHRPTQPPAAAPESAARPIPTTTHATPPSPAPTTAAAHPAQPAPQPPAPNRAQPVQPAPNIAIPPAGRAALTQSSALNLDLAYPAALKPAPTPTWLTHPATQTPQTRTAAA